MGDLVGAYVAMLDGLVWLIVGLVVGGLLLCAGVCLAMCKMASQGDEGG